MARKVILDVDTGTDDAVSIMFAALHPELDLVGVTTVAGNVPIEHTTDNTLRVLDWVGRPDVPVYQGLARPVGRLGLPSAKHFADDSEQDPHGTTLDVPAPRSVRQRTGAVEYLVETLRSTTEPLTLVPSGPLSNIATMLAVDPSLADAVDEIVIMGGGHAVSNVTPSAEFNVWADPEAANVVLTAGFPRLTLITLDATHQALITKDACTALDNLGTPAGVAAARFIGRRIDAYAGVTGHDSAPVHDVVCTAYLVRPDVIATRHLHVEVETDGPLTVGRTVIDTRADSRARPTAHVAFTADPTLLTALLTEVFARTA